MQPQPQRQVVRLKFAFAGLMAGLVLLLALVASSEKLHHKLHGNPADGQVPCAICAVARGHMDVPISTASSLAVGLVVAWNLPGVESALPYGVDVSVASSRGPPASVSSQS